jgi:hypothetical protein
MRCTAADITLRLIPVMRCCDAHGGYRFGAKWNGNSARLPPVLSFRS